MSFAQSRYYPVNHKTKKIFLEPKGRKYEAMQAHPGCDGVSGFELEHAWAKFEQQGYKLIGEFKENRGGPRPNSGRPKLLKPIKTKNVRVNQTLHEELLAHIAYLKKQSGKHIAIQDYVSKLILDSAKDWNTLVPEIRTIKGEVGYVHLPEEVIDKLEWMLKKIKPLRKDLYVTGTKVLNAIILTHLKTE